jgi:hypothetical protein
MNQLTEKQIAWAKSHDWFYGTNPSGEILVLDRYTTKNGAYHEDTIVWNKSFGELRNWAGY